MRKSNYGLAAVACVALLVAGCETFRVESEKRSLGSSTALLTKADQRAITSVAIGDKQFNRGAVTPRRITCAEPSPDVAKAISEAFSLDFKGAGTVGKVPIELALALARSRSEAMAQLGERLATIQLLRDVLFRACEGFANGAITRTSYAVILAGIDSTMISMLTMEMVAGAFGRQLAAAGAASGGNSAVADSLVKAAKDKFSKANKAYNDARKETTKKTIALETAKTAKLKENPTDKQKLDVKNAETALADAKKAEARALTTRTERAEELAVAKLTAERSRAGISTTAGGTIAGRGKPNEKVADALVKIHERATSEDAAALQSVMLACITSLDSTPAMGGDATNNLMEKADDLAEVRQELEEFQKKVADNANAGNKRKLDEKKADLKRATEALQVAAVMSGLTPFGIQCMTTLIPAVLERAKKSAAENDILKILNKLPTELLKLDKKIDAMGKKMEAMKLNEKVNAAKSAAKKAEKSADTARIAAEAFKYRRAYDLCLVLLTRNEQITNENVAKCLDKITAPAAAKPSPPAKPSKTKK